ncbi:hypothetical protein EDD11_001698, partial [Mortierella claussenii]
MAESSIPQPMPLTGSKRRYVGKNTTTPHRKKPTPLRIPSDKRKKYSKAELDDINKTRRQRYEDLLKSARTGDMSAGMMFPNAEKFGLPMAK